MLCSGQTWVKVEFVCLYEIGFKMSTCVGLAFMLIQQDPVGHYQLGQKNTVYLEMIYLGVQCMYFRAKPLQNQCILELVHYTK